MRKFIAVMLVNAILLSAVAGCGKEDEIETTTSASATQIQTEKETEIIIETSMITAKSTETMTKQETDIEIPLENLKSYMKDGIFVVNKGEYKLEFKKTEYEKNFSSEVLKEIYEINPMWFGLTFGCDDYDNWNGTPNVVLNDIYQSMGCWRLDSYDYDTDEVKRANEELNASPYGHENCEGFYTSVDKINSFLRNVYGPEARVFKAEDFDTYNEIKTSEESIFENYDYSFRFAYLPESDIVRCFARETWGGETEASCICDIRMSDGEYIVEVVSDTYAVYCIKFIMTMGCEPNGNIYVKSVEDFYVLPDGIENNLKVISEDVEVKSQKYNSGDWIVVDTLSVGDEVYSLGNIDSDREYMWIVTDEYVGRVEKKHLATIE